MERQVPHLVQNYRVLLREFQMATPPIILVVNGYQNYKNEAVRERKKDGDLRQALNFGMAVAEEIGLNFVKVIAGAEKADLGERIRDELCATLAGTTPKTSSIKTFEQLEEELTSCENDQAAAEREK